MKKTFAAVVVLCCSVAFAQANTAANTGKGAEMKDQKAAQGQMKGAEMKDMKGGEMKGTEMKEGAQAQMPFHPMKVTEDKKGLDALYKTLMDAMKKGDVETAAANYDFPVMMVTDDSAGNAMAESWDKAKWTKTMSDTMKNMPMDPKMTSKQKYTFLSNGIAFVESTNTATMGGKKTTWKSGAVVIKKDGKWMVKSEQEGGWGDMMKGTGGAPMMNK